MQDEKETFTNTRLLIPEEAARILRVSVETLNVWRATNRYPLPYVKVGRLVRYREQDVMSFVQSRMKVFV